MLVGLKHGLPNIYIKLLEVESIQVFQLIAQKRSAIPDIIPIILRLSLVKTNIDVPKIFDRTLLAFVLFIY